MRTLAFLALLLAAARAAGAAGPITYVLDYGPKHVDRPEYLAEVASGPPMLLHLGKDVPFTHNWGPIQALGGENQAYGKGEHVRRLAPAEVRARIASLKTMVEGLHKAGVTMVMPYVCAITLAGHHERRTGFWEFYDRWDEYAEFALGPKPPADPITWMQRRPDGQLQRFYTYEGDFYPPYEPNHRYVACVNNPHWRAWLLKVVELTAQCGYDGVFVDNAGSQRCYCDVCRGAFRQFLARRYKPAERAALFGAEDPALAAEKGTLAWVETQRFWKESLRQHLAAIRGAGERVRGKGRFHVFPNGGESRPEDVRLSFADTDFLMFERTSGDNGTHPGVVRVPVVEEIAVREVNDNVFEYKLTHAPGRRVQPILLTSAGYPRRLPWCEMTPDSALLGMAEGAAYGGGGGFLVPPKWPAYAPALTQYRAFFESRAALFEGVRPWAPVAVLALGEQKLYGNIQHIESVRQVTRALLDAHVLFDYVLEEHLSAADLAGYQAILIPNVEVMDLAAVRALRAYVGAGGAALVVGPAPSKDSLLRPLAETLPATGEPDEALGASVRTEGRGRWVLAPRFRPGRYVARWLARAAEDDLALTAEPSLVRFNAFRGQGRLLLHAVNYDVPLGTPPAPAVPAPDLRVRVPLPAGTQSVSAVVHDPERPQPVPLPCAFREGRCELTLSGLRIYQVVEIRVR